MFFLVDESIRGTESRVIIDTVDVIDHNGVVVGE